MPEAASGDFLFVDETAVSRWAIPECEVSIVHKHQLENLEHQRHVKDELEITLLSEVLECDVKSSDDQLTQTAAATAESKSPLTVLSLRRQQIEWANKTESKRIRNNLKRNREERALKSVAAATTISEESTPASTIDATCKILTGSREPAVKASQKRSVLPRSELLRARTTKRAALERVLSLEAKLVDVLTYTGSIMRAVNIGNAAKLKDLLDRILTPSCVMRLSLSPAAPVDKIVPRDMIADFFLAMLDSVPDVVWRIEDTKMLKGLPRSVSSMTTTKGNTRQVYESN